jgi:ABC-type sugar transport system permease subunit
MQKKKLVRYSKYGYLFSIPFVLAFLVFGLYPTLNTLILGFTDLKGAVNDICNLVSGWFDKERENYNFFIDEWSVKTIIIFVNVYMYFGSTMILIIAGIMGIGTRCNNAGLTMLMYVQNQVFSGGYLYNRAAAASVILALLCSGLAVIVFYLRRDKNEAMLKKLRRIERREAKRLKQDT